MKKLRTIIIICGILVAGVAFSSVAQEKPEKNKAHKEHSLKHEKHKNKDHKKFKGDRKAHKGEMKARKGEMKSHKKHYARKSED
jgi:hypothetical protein